MQKKAERYQAVMAAILQETVLIPVYLTLCRIKIVLVTLCEIDWTAFIRVFIKNDS